MHECAQAWSLMCVRGWQIDDLDKSIAALFAKSQQQVPKHMSMHMSLHTSVHMSIHMSMHMSVHMPFVLSL